MPERWVIEKRERLTCGWCGRRRVIREWDVMEGSILMGAIVPLCSECSSRPENERG